MKRISSKGIERVLLAGLVVLPALASAQQSATSPRAETQLQPLAGSGVTGTVTLEQQGQSVAVKGMFKGLRPGKHGFHIHEGRSCTNRGGHFSPANALHGAPDAADDKRHAGDLGNIVVQDDGSATYSNVIKNVTLIGANSIEGRVLVVHSGEDDLVSQPSGKSGDQIACGVIKAVPQ